MRELIVDSFAGGGGASEGIRRALGRDPDIAINHDAAALSMHRANHPGTRHLCSDVWEVNPVTATGGRPVGLMWASPDCKHFSKAKGGAPVSPRVRGLAWVVAQWAAKVRPRVIILENVEEFTTWGPVGSDGRPCAERKGHDFKRFVYQLERGGYRVEWRELRACDYGAPTIRKRLFLIARRDGLPIVWPAPTHSAPQSVEVLTGTRKPWRTAAEIIDWSLPCPSIFASSEEIMARHGVRAIRPLAEATLARIARGVRRYVLDAARPFIVPAQGAPFISYAQQGGGLRPADAPLHTVTASSKDQNQVVMAHVTKFRGGATGHPIDVPLATVTANGFEARPGGAVPLGIVSAFLAQHNTGLVGHDVRAPLSTVVGTGSTQALVAAHLTQFYGSASSAYGGDLASPLATVTSSGTHQGLVAAFLAKYYGTDQDPRLGEPLHTVTTRDRFGVVTVEIGGEPYAIVDIGMRMLTPRELFRAQGFRDDYEIAEGMEHDGSVRVLTKSEQNRMCGNSVCPDMAEAIVAANVSLREAPIRRAMGTPLFEGVAA
jgi:DNA (cytosine-5)-methyltransferase 1